MPRRRREVHDLDGRHLVEQLRAVAEALPLAPRGCAAPPGAPPKTALTFTVPTGSARQAALRVRHVERSARWRRARSRSRTASVQRPRRSRAPPAPARPGRTSPRASPRMSGVHADEHRRRVERARAVGDLAAGQHPRARGERLGHLARARARAAGGRPGGRCRSAHAAASADERGEERRRRWRRARRSARRRCRSARRWRTRPARPGRPPRSGRRRRRRSAASLPPFSSTSSRRSARRRAAIARPGRGSCRRARRRRRPAARRGAAPIRPSPGRGCSRTPSGRCAASSSASRRPVVRAALAGLVHDRVAGHQRGTEQARRDGDRVVPRGHGGDDAARLGDHEVRRVPGPVQAAAPVQRAELGVLAQRADAGLDAAARVAERACPSRGCSGRRARRRRRGRPRRRRAGRRRARPQGCGPTRRPLRAPSAGPRHTAAAWRSARVRRSRRCAGRAR